MSKEDAVNVYSEFYKTLPPVYNQEENESFIKNNTGKTSEEISKRLDNIK